MPSEIFIIVIELMFLGVNTFLALVRQSSLCRAKNIFTPKTDQLYFDMIITMIMIATVIVIKYL